MLKQIISRKLDNIIPFTFLLVCMTLLPSFVMAQNTAGSIPAIISYLLSRSTPIIPPITVIGSLNDTGIVTCANETSNGLTCPVSDYLGQDAQYGRDATDNNKADGHAGFSFTKLDASGQALSSGASQWSCVKDNVTGLIWEVKTTEGGLQDNSQTYTWYNSTGHNDGGSAGTENGGSCYESGYCDTEGYVHQVNQQGLCGAKDWRLPTTSELEGLVNFNQIKPTIETAYFPNIRSRSLYYWSSYWSSSPFSSYSGNAWCVHFSYGSSSYAHKNSSMYVRLVRMGQ